MNYLATFYTQAAAILTARTFKKAGVPCKAGPVPRELSSSCGTCVRYQASTPLYDALDRDVESVYEQNDEKYRLLLKRE